MAHFLQQLHLHPLDFSLSNLFSLSAIQLALVDFHSSTTPDISLRAKELWWARRQELIAKNNNALKASSNGNSGNDFEMNGSSKGKEREIDQSSYSQDQPECEERLAASFIPPEFERLVDILRFLRKGGNMEPEKRTLGISLYQEVQLETSELHRYLNRAESLKIIKQRRGPNRFHTVELNLIQSRSPRNVNNNGRNASGISSSSAVLYSPNQAIPYPTSTVYENDPALTLKYLPLIRVLQAQQAAGQLRPLRAHVGAELRHANPAIYRDSGIPSFRNYAFGAEACGIVVLGSGAAGQEWIELVSDHATDRPPGAFSFPTVESPNSPFVQDPNTNLVEKDFYLVDLDFPLDDFSVLTSQQLTVVHLRDDGSPSSGLSSTERAEGLWWKQRSKDSDRGIEWTGSVTVDLPAVQERGRYDQMVVDEDQTSPVYTDSTSKALLPASHPDWFNILPTDAIPLSVATSLKSLFLENIPINSIQTAEDLASLFPPHLYPDAVYLFPPHNGDFSTTGLIAYRNFERFVRASQETNLIVVDTRWKLSASIVEGDYSEQRAWTWEDLSEGIAEILWSEMTAGAAQPDYEEGEIMEVPEKEVEAVVGQASPQSDIRDHDSLTVDAPPLQQPRRVSPPPPPSLSINTTINTKSSLHGLPQLQISFSELPQCLQDSDSQDRSFQKHNAVAWTVGGQKESPCTFYLAFERMDILKEARAWYREESLMSRFVEVTTRIMGTKRWIDEDIVPEFIDQYTAETIQSAPIISRSPEHGLDTVITPISNFPSPSTTTASVRPDSSSKRLRDEPEGFAFGTAEHSYYIPQRKKIVSTTVLLPKETHVLSKRSGANRWAGPTSFQAQPSRQPPRPRTFSANSIPIPPTRRQQRTIINKQRARDHKDGVRVLETSFQHPVTPPESVTNSSPIFSSRSAESMERRDSLGQYERDNNEHCRSGRSSSVEIMEMGPSRPVLRQTMASAKPQLSSEAFLSARGNEEDELEY